jgi:hypothetical protein
MVPRGIFGRLPVVALCLGVVWLGCDARISNVEDVPDVSSLVTRDVAVKLTEEGHFALADVPAPGESEITQAQALELAVHWARDFIHLSKRRYEQEHGGPIDFEALRPCGRVYFARSAFSSPGSFVPKAVRRGEGSWWLVRMCNRSGLAQILLGVSALNGDYWRTLRGEAPLSPDDAGAWFESYPIPLGRAGEWMLAPEEAVRRVARLTGELIAKEPELFALDGPFWSAWRIEIARPARVRARSGGTQLESREFYVGRFVNFDSLGVLSATPAIAVPAAEQPPGVVVYYWDRSQGARLYPSTRRSALAPLRPGATVRVILVDETVSLR